MVDFARLSSQISRDGQVVTDARFFVKTRGQKALRMVLPEGVKLWEARVENEVVNARADGDEILIPLPPRMNPNEPVEVAMRLGQTAGRAAASGAGLAADAGADGDRRMDAAQRSRPAARAAGRNGRVDGIEPDGERV